MDRRALLDGSLESYGPTGAPSGPTDPTEKFKKSPLEPYTETSDPNSGPYKSPHIYGPYQEVNAPHKRLAERQQ